MEKALQRISVRNLILVVAIAELFSSFTLWLLGFSIKYPLFIVETLSIVTIYAILHNLDFNFVLKKISLNKVSLAMFFDISLIYFSTALIILNQLNTDNNIRLVITFFCTSGLSGFALLNISGVTKYFSKLEILILSCITGFIFSGSCTLLLLKFDESTRIFLIPFLFIVLGIVSLVKHGKSKNSAILKTPSLSRNIDILAIVVCVAFYAVIFYYLYPNLTDIGADISRHFQQSVVISRTPDLYSGFGYLLFHAYGSTFYNLSGDPKMESFQSMQIILCFLLPLSVYAIAKRFLIDIDKRIPSISIIFYTMLSNLSFFYFTKLKIVDTNNSGVHLFETIAMKTYNESMYFSQPFMWFSPPTISFVILIVAFILLRVWSIPRSKFIPLFTVLILSSYLIHVAEVTIFVVILAAYALISKSKSLRLDDALLSSLIAFILATGVLVYTQTSWPTLTKDPGIDQSTMLAAIFPASLVLITMFWRKKILPRIHLHVIFFNSKKFYQILSIILLGVYITGIAVWFFSMDSSSLTQNSAEAIPWFTYPLVLGVVGILAILSIRYMGEILPNSYVAILLGFIIFLLVLGKMISFVNLNLFFSGYYETRFIPLIFIFVCLLAPISLIKLTEYSSRKRKTFAKIAFPLGVAFVIFLGFSSSGLISEYWSIMAYSPVIQPEEFQALDYLKSIFQHDSHAYMIAPSNFSSDTLVFSTSPYVLTNTKVLMDTEDPALGNYLLNAHHLSHAYIYLETRDFDILEKGGWFGSHLLRTIPLVFSNKFVTIYNSTHVSYPHSNSDTSMLVPIDDNIASPQSLYYAYDLISKHDYNYTVLFDRDQNALKTKTVILSYDPPENKNTVGLHDLSSLNDWKVITGNWISSADGIHGDDVLGNSRQIALSTLSSNNFTLNTSFKILETNPSLPSYVYFIYSWKDHNNFGSATITILNEKTFVQFQTIRGGKVHYDSNWPGKETGMSWQPNALFNVTLIKQAKSENLILNDTEYSHPDGSDQSGYIGLGYTRAHIVYDHVDLNQMEKPGLQDLPDYLTYVKSGGSLIVLNTNGYGTFSNEFFRLNDSSFVTSKIVMPDSPPLFVNTTVLPALSSENIIPLAYYASQETNSSILVADENVGLGKIRYVNIFPIIMSLNENRMSASSYQEILDKISSMMDLKPLNPEPRKIYSNVNFKDMNGSGNVVIKTNSIILPLLQISNLTIQANNDQISVGNVTKLNFSSYQKVILHTNRIDLSNGNGLYGKLVIGNLVKMDFQNNISIDAQSNNGSAHHFNNVSNIVFQNNEPVEVYAFQPKISIDGITSFSNFYGPTNFTNILNSGKNIAVSGNVSLTMFMSNTQTFGNNISKR